MTILVWNTAHKGRELTSNHFSFFVLLNRGIHTFHDHKKVSNDNAALRGLLVYQ